jgi:hypothetical protein
VDRDSRRLSHQKSNKTITQTNIPLSSQGDDGDQIMVGSTLYTKSQGRWVPINPIVSGVHQWENLELLNNWTNYSSSEYMMAGVMIDEVGIVHLRGTITNSSDRTEDICTLPPIYRPHRSVNLTMMSENTPYRLYVDNYSGEKGNMKYINITASSGWATLDGGHWWVGKERLRQL